MMNYLLLLALTLTHHVTRATPPSPTPTNLRPIIGIVSQPHTSTPGLSYVAASYVKFVEMAGGRAVPLKYGDASLAEIDTLMEGLNGVLFPGGGADITDASSPYYQFAAHIWNKAIALNDQGQHYPVWGTCLGFEFIHVMAGGPDLDILQCDFDSEDLALPLNFTGGAGGDARAGSTLLGPLSDALYTAMSTKAITQNEHKCGVPTSAYDGASSKVKAFFDVRATNVDRKGKPFVSLVEGKDYPVYGMQAHPEKNNFEWVGGATKIGVHETGVFVWLSDLVLFWLLFYSCWSTGDFGNDPDPPHVGRHANEPVLCQRVCQRMSQERQRVGERHAVVVLQLQPDVHW